MKPIIKIQNLSKQYRLGTIGTGTLSNDMKRWWYRIRGKEDPFLKIGESNDRSQKGDSEYVWALRNINLEVMPGEVLGIIGKNGAGKSTLLKILSKVTGPTTGSISFNGRIGSLLEVGTGFHPELTGRENIFLNGAILGMTKQEIRSKLDEIVDFSGCERYIDTPVKRYSSGMTVRLGFAVAAHLEPEILVVDEVLAVGDAEFQKKAIGKMQDVSKNDGRTVLFVSHNMASIQFLCTKCMVLNNGTLNYIGQTNHAIEHYLQNRASGLKLYDRKDRIGGEDFRFSNITFLSERGTDIETVKNGSTLRICISAITKKNIDNIVIRIIIVDSNGIELTVLNNFHTGNLLSVNKNEIEFYCQIDKLTLARGNYNLHILALNQGNTLDEVEFAKSFEVIEGDFYKTGKHPYIKVPFYIEHKWYQD